MVKQSTEEIRREVLEVDAQKDVSIYLSVPIGVVSGISALAAICAIVTARALVYFRQGVDVYWLCCVPFLFPVVTGLFAAYKKQFALLGVHLTVTLLALLMGGFGFGMSVGPLFINRHICQQVHAEVSCEKVSLSYLYLVSGALAAGFAVLDFLLALLALHCATKRIAKREQQAQLQHRQEQMQKQMKIRKKIMTENEGRRRAFSVCSTTSDPQQALLQHLNAQAERTEK